MKRMSAQSSPNIKMQSYKQESKLREENEALYAR